MSPKPASSPYGGRSFAFSEARVAAARRSARLDDADAQGRRSWRDDGCMGLTLVVNVGSGSAAYYYQGKANGQTTRRALGDVDVVTLQEAREAVNRLRFDRTVTAVLTPRAVERDEADDDVDDSPLVSTVADAMLDAHAAGRWLPGNRSRVPTDRTMKFYRDLRAAQLKAHEGLTLRAFADKLPASIARSRRRHRCRPTAYFSCAGTSMPSLRPLGCGAPRILRLATARSG
jgi:hypothetical protein